MIINQNTTFNINKPIQRSNKSKEVRCISNNNYYCTSFGSVIVPRNNDGLLKRIGSFAESKVAKLFTKADKKIEELRPIDVNNSRSIEEISCAYTKKRKEIKDDYLIFRKGHHIKEANMDEALEKERFLNRKARDVEKNQNRAKQTEKIVEQLIADLAQEDPEVGIKRRAAAEVSNLKKASFDKLKGFDKIAGYREEKNILQEYVINSIKAEKSGETPQVPGSILFFGPTGNGKSTFAKAFADAAGCGEMVHIDRYGFDKAEKERSFLNELYEAANLSKKKFDKTRERTIIFVDEFDSISDETSVILDDLEKFFATCSKDFHCTIFACTNEPEKIFKNKTENETKNGLDPNITTNFPCRVALNPPDKIDAKMTFEHYLTGRTAGEVDYNLLAEELYKKAQAKGGAFSNSQIRYLCLGKDAAKLENDADAFKNSRKDISQEDMLKLIRAQETLPAIKDLTQFHKDEDAFIGYGQAIL